jgi:hypothetical protein
MEWLTDQDRRAEEWLQRLQPFATADSPRVTPLPNGGVRFDAAYKTGKGWVQRVRHEDLDSWSHGFERIHLVEFFHDGRSRLGYALLERVTLEPGQDGTGVTVTMRSRMTGKSLLFKFLGRDADRASHQIERHLAGQADFRIGELTSHFSTPGASAS